MDNPKNLLKDIPPHVTILAAEDDHFQSELLRVFFKKHDIPGYVLPHGQAVLDFFNQYPTHDIHVIILDLHMPVLNGMDTLKRLHDIAPQIPVLFLTGSNDVTQAINAIREGAFDYIVKPFDPDRLSLTIRNAEQLLRLQRAAQPSKWRTLSNVHLDDLIGHDRSLSHLITTARKIAVTDVPVLIGGETGTGKEVFAHAIHNDSPRAPAPFVAINCGAIPENLIESILFGHEKGAFTGAINNTPGKFREAEGGTIFLDEIGDMPLSAQVRLLRVLQQHEVQPVGASTSIPINVRIIAATNKNLENAVTTGIFREDLFYRLNVVPLTLPPLRQRVNDILPLAKHFIDRFMIEDGLPFRTLAHDAEEKLCAHTWPGNVRELENTIRRAMVLASSELIHAYDLQMSNRGVSRLPISPISSPINVPQPLQNSVHLDLIDQNGSLIPLDQLEQKIVAHAFQICKGNIHKTARALGVARTTIYRKLNIEET